MCIVPAQCSYDGRQKLWHTSPYFGRGCKLLAVFFTLVWHSITSQSVLSSLKNPRSTTVLCKYNSSDFSDLSAVLAQSSAVAFWVRALFCQNLRELSVESRAGGGGVLLEKLGRGVRPASQNPYPIYDQNLRYFFSLFMTWPKIWYPIYDLSTQLR